MPRNPDWSPAHRELAAATYAKMMDDSQELQTIWAAIGRQVHRRAGTVKQYFYNHNRSFLGECIDRLPSIPSDRRPVMGGLRLSAQQIAERDARIAAADRRNYTQIFFGDPPPGHSQLEEYQRRQAARAASSGPVISIAASVGQMRGDYR